jgi:hypothetical protein
MMVLACDLRLGLEAAMSFFFSDVATFWNSSFFLILQLLLVDSSCFAVIFHHVPFFMEGHGED